MADLTISAVEGAVLTGVATVGAFALAGEFGPLSPIVKVLSVFAVAVTGFLGYSAYRTAAK